MQKNTTTCIHYNNVSFGSSDKGKNMLSAYLQSQLLGSVDCHLPLKNSLKCAIVCAVEYRDSDKNCHQHPKCVYVCYWKYLLCLKNLLKSFDNMLVSVMLIECVWHYPFACSWKSKFYFHAHLHYLLKLIIVTVNGKRGHLPHYSRLSYLWRSTMVSCL